MNFILIFKFNFYKLPFYLQQHISYLNVIYISKCNQMNTWNIKLHKTSGTVFEMKLNF